jgi:hypothetical protein
MISPTVTAALITAAATVVVAVGGWGVRTIRTEIRASRQEAAREHQEVWKAVTDNYQLTKQIAEEHDIDLDDPGHPLEGRTFDDEE